MRRFAWLFAMIMLCSVTQPAMAQLSTTKFELPVYAASNDKNTSTDAAADIEIVYPDEDCLSYALNHTTGEASIMTHGSGHYGGEVDKDKTLKIPEVVKGCRVTTVEPGAFTYFEIDTLIFPETLRVIEDNALQFASFRHIVLPSSVEEISPMALVLCDYEMLTVDAANPHFATRDNILYNKDFTALLHYPETLSNTSFTVPDSVTRIGDGAFYGTQLTSVSLPDSIVEIGDYAFSQSALTSFAVPPQITALNEGVFAVCGSLASVSLPEKLVSIGPGAFSNCLSLGNLDLPSRIQEIGSFAFNNCKAFTAVTLPSTDCTLGDAAYMGCDSIREVVFPVGTIDIPTELFFDCDALASVIIPSSVRTIGDRAFSGGDALAEIRVAPGNKSFRIENGALLSMDGTTLLQYLLAGRDTDYTISESVTTVAAGAFYQAAYLKNVRFPKNLQSIKENAFGECTALASVALPDGVRSIGNDVFRGCENLARITLPKSLRSIGDYAFAQTAVSTVALPDALDSLGTSAFSYCMNLEKIAIPASCARIPDGCFAGCDKLRDVTIPEGVISIGKCAFYDCYGIEALSIPDSVTSISCAAFAINEGYCCVDTIVCTPGSYTDTIFSTLTVENRLYNDHAPIPNPVGKEIAVTNEVRISAICYVDEGNALMLRIENFSDEAIPCFRAAWDGSWSSGHLLRPENPYESYSTAMLQPGETGDYFMSLRFSSGGDYHPSGFRMGENAMPYDADDSIVEIIGKRITITAYAEDGKTVLFRAETIPFPEKIG